MIPDLRQWRLFKHHKQNRFLTWLQLFPPKHIFQKIALFHWHLYIYFLNYFPSGDTLVLWKLLAEVCQVGCLAKGVTDGLRIWLSFLGNQPTSLASSLIAEQVFWLASGVGCSHLLEIWPLVFCPKYNVSSLEFYTKQQLFLPATTSHQENTALSDALL